jgi:hypothetical protein
MELMKARQLRCAPVRSGLSNFICNGYLKRRSRFTVLMQPIYGREMWLSEVPYR